MGNFSVFRKIPLTSVSKQPQNSLDKRAKHTVFHKVKKMGLNSGLVQKYLIFDIYTSRIKYPIIIWGSYACFSIWLSVSHCFISIFYTRPPRNTLSTCVLCTIHITKFSKWVDSHTKFKFVHDSHHIFTMKNKNVLTALATEAGDAVARLSVSKRSLTLSARKRRSPFLRWRTRSPSSTVLKLSVQLGVRGPSRHSHVVLTFCKQIKEWMRFSYHHPFEPFKVVCRRLSLT